MTPEFNITIPGAEIIKRLIDLEQQLLDLANRQTIDRMLLDTATGKIADLQISPQPGPRLDALEHRLTEMAMTYAPVVYVDKSLEIMGKRYPTAERVERVAEDLSELRDRVEALEAVATHKLAAEPNLPANDPEPPVDTSWHPYDPWVEGVHHHPKGDERLVVLVRNNEVVGPGHAKDLDWSECADNTIIAWRYAKKGE